MKWNAFGQRMVMWLSKSKSYEGGVYCVQQDYRLLKLAMRCHVSVGPQGVKVHTTARGLTSWAAGHLRKLNK
ncbi:hypothetical protein FRX31_024459 [Thalictrum thalictroides]|uniref:Uncharacterized protein n=1 Tax=Thalictrum thalictroides TaxID=46969 RepID=A0A7J6VLG1_THATH|nr:hypothetical protein FRX31_024459 [Thalictrum thalictroides]